MCGDLSPLQVLIKDKEEHEDYVDCEYDESSLDGDTPVLWEVSSVVCMAYISRFSCLMTLGFVYTELLDTNLEGIRRGN